MGKRAIGMCAALLAILLLVCVVVIGVDASGTAQAVPQASTDVGQRTATRADLLTALNNLRDALLSQYNRDVDLTASTFIYTSQYRRNTRISELMARALHDLANAIDRIDAGLPGSGADVTELVKGQVLDDAIKAQQMLASLPDAGASKSYDVAACSAALSALSATTGP